MNNQNPQNPIDGQLTIIDDQGNEKLCQILFTLESEEFGKKYVVFYEISELTDADDDSEIELMAASYVETEDGTGELQEIETDAEWEYIDAAVNNFNEQCDEDCENCDVADCPDRVKK